MYCANISARGASLIVRQLTTKRWYLPWQRMSRMTLLHCLVTTSVWSISIPTGRRCFGKAQRRAGGVQAEDSFGAERKAAFAATCTRAFMLAPVMKSGRLVACLTADFKVPHHWTPAEIRFLEETAERTSAAVERARAEGASQSAQLGRFASAASDVAARPAGPMSGRLVRWRGTPAFLPRR